VKTLRWLRAAACIPVFCAASLAQTPKASYPGILNYLCLDDHYSTGGQPSMDDLGRMKAEGVKAIINLRRPTEFDAEGEAAKAKELGLRYFLIPVDSKNPNDEEAAAFLKILDDPQNRPAFIHCASANRVGAFWMIRRVLVDGWSVEDAEHEADKIGLRGPELRAFARDYIRRHVKKPS
jgi:uncharacterized protein (TIGR01244 family)